MAHTPGPWAMQLTNSKLIANVFTDTTDDAQWMVIVSIGKRNDPNFEDDARLISAAPELLEACEAALDELEPYEWTDLPDGTAVIDTIEQLRAAIAKAKGEQS